MDFLKPQFRKILTSQGLDVWRDQSQQGVLHYIAHGTQEQVQEWVARQHVRWPAAGYRTSFRALQENVADDDFIVEGSHLTRPTNMGQKAGHLGTLKSGCAQTNEQGHCVL